jgi:2-polyprenyl-6-methoxyphenol hydroxylase-like FAD-dependent oxidoreductase
MVTEGNRVVPGRIRTLIIGAGIGGLTLASLMKQRGEQPLIIEREEKINDRGYMLGIYPMGSNVLHGLRLHQAFMRESVSMTQYHIGNGKGEIIREYSLEEVTLKYGSIQGISRGKLIDLLQTGAGGLPIRFGTTVTQINQRDDEVEVALSDGSTERFDLVVAADGLHSQTRSMILDKDEFDYWNTGWGGWVFWADSAAVSEDTYVEYWGAGRFLLRK